MKKIILLVSLISCLSSAAPIVTAKITPSNAFDYYFHSGDKKHVIEVDIRGGGSVYNAYWSLSGTGKKFDSLHELLKYYNWMTVSLIEPVEFVVKND
ncbi:MAG: hypothetical protein ACRC92_27550 [Peptostreptococcaceae bacterium]